MSTNIKINFKKIKVKEIEKLPYTRLIYLSLVINITTIALVYVLQPKLPPEVPLLYGMAEDEAKIAAKTSLIVPSLISTSIVIFNTLLSLIYNDAFIRKILIASSFTISALSTITVVKIVFLVGNI